MKIRAKNVRTYGKFIFNCLKCEKKIICDQQRFLEEPKQITCKCGYVHVITEWKPRKGGMNLSVED